MKGGTMVPFGFKYHAFHKMPDYSGKKNHECIDHALNQGKRHHVAVGNMAYFMRQHAFDLILVHVLKQARAYRHQCVVAVHAGRKGIDVGRVINRHFRHANTDKLGLAPDSFHQPAFGRVGRLLDHHRASHAFRGPLGHGERNQRTAKPYHSRP